MTERIMLKDVEGEESRRLLRGFLGQNSSAATHDGAMLPLPKPRIEKAPKECRHA